MRTTAFVLLIMVSFLSSAAPVEAVVAGPGNISTELLRNIEQPNFLPPLDRLGLIVPEGVNLPAALIEPIPNDLSPLDPSGAVGRNVPGATGGLTHSACGAGTARRRAAGQPPLIGRFPCVVPTSNASGSVDGVCFVNECRGVASTGLDGLLSALGGISSLGSIVSGIFEKLLQKEQSGGDPSAAPATQPPPRHPSSSKLMNFSPLICRNCLVIPRPLCATCFLPWILKRSGLRCGR